LDLHKKLADATIPADRELYERQIDATDREIDAVVYELYGLTHEEMDVVGEPRQFHCQRTLCVCWRQRLLLYSRSKSSGEMPACLRIVRNVPLGMVVPGWFGMTVRRVVAGWYQIS